MQILQCPSQPGEATWRISAGNGHIIMKGLIFRDRLYICKCDCHVVSTMLLSFKRLGIEIHNFFFFLSWWKKETLFPLLECSNSRSVPIFQTFVSRRENWPSSQVPSLHNSVCINLRFRHYPSRVIHTLRGAELRELVTGPFLNHLLSFLLHFSSSDLRSCLAILNLTIPPNIFESSEWIFFSNKKKKKNPNL